MELLALLFGLFCLITVFLPWINRARIKEFLDKIDRLDSRIRELESKLNYELSGRKPSKNQSLAQKEVLVHEQKVDQNKDKQDSALPAHQEQEDAQKQKTQTKPKLDEPLFGSVPRFEAGDFAEKLQSTFEQNIATKLPVWIGSFCLILAAYFLVKYSMEFGWLGPIARVSLGTLFGAGLLGAGSFVAKRPEIANATRISQGLIGAGLVALYVSLYAAIHLYSLIPPVMGFAGMSVVTALAVILSLRHGQPIAVFGLLGGLLTPALVGSDEPNAIALFTYLFLLFSGVFVVLIRNGWWILAIMALFGVFGWSALWFALVFASSDAFVLVLFAIALTAVVLGATGKRIADNSLKSAEEYPVHILNTLAITGGAATIIWLSFEISLTLFDWSMLGLLSLALIALSYFKPVVYQKALFVKLGASVLLLLVWLPDASLSESLLVVLGMITIYIGASFALMRRVSDPRFWAILQVIAAIALYLVSYWALALPSWVEDKNGGFGGMFWGILSLILASLAIFQAADIRAKYKADDVIQTHLVAIYALAGSAFISLGLAIELPFSYLPLAFAGQIAATAWVYQRTKIPVLKYVMYILTLTFIAMNWEQLALFANIILHSLFGEAPSRYVIGKYILDEPLVKLGIPALLMYLSLAVVLRNNKTFKEKNDQKLIHALFGTANVLMLFTAYYIFRDIFHSGEGHIFSSNTGFIERGIITMTLAGAGIAMLEFIRKYDIEFLKPWGVAIFRMAIIRFVYFDFFLHNPYWSQDQFVGDIPLINGVTLTYGFGLLAVIWALYSKDLIAKTQGMRRAYAVIALVTIFALTSLTVRQYFQGGFLAQGDMGASELYAYSVIWLLTGIAFLSAGIKFKNKTARMVSIGFVGLAVVKVFLIDAAELEGLYRVFSFLGLGISLIGLSYFYTRFVFGQGKNIRG